MPQEDTRSSASVPGPTLPAGGATPVGPGTVGPVPPPGEAELPQTQPSQPQEGEPGLPPGPAGPTATPRGG